MIAIFLFNLAPTQFSVLFDNSTDNTKSITEVSAIVGSFIIQPLKFIGYQIFHRKELV